MIQLQGSKEYSVTAEQLYPELADLTRLVRTLPEVKTVKEVSEDHAVLTVAPGFSFVKGELETTIDRVAAQSPVSAELQIASKGIGTNVKVVASFSIAPHETGSMLHWQATVQEIGGLLKLLPPSLLKGAAQKVIDNWLASLQQLLK